MMNTAAARIWDDVDAVAVWVESLNTDMYDVEELSVEQAIEVLDKVRRSLTLLRMIEAGTERWVAEIFRDQKWGKEREFDGLGTVEVQRSTTRRAWDHEALAKEWMDRLMEQRGGELPSPFEVRDALLKTVGVSYWKVGALKELGIDPDDFCDATPSAPRVKVTTS